MDSKFWNSLLSRLPQNRVSSKRVGKRRRTQDTVFWGSPEKSEFQNLLSTETQDTRFRLCAVAKVAIPLIIDIAAQSNTPRYQPSHMMMGLLIGRICHGVSKVSLNADSVPKSQANPATKTHFLGRVALMCARHDNSSGK